MRLRQLRKLEEIELRREQDGLLAERAELDALLGDEALMWRRIADEVGGDRRAVRAADAARPAGGR